MKNIFFSVCALLFLSFPYFSWATDDDSDGYHVEFGDCDDTTGSITEATDSTCDGDGDGAIDQTAGGTDCNDDEASISPDASELCDGVDNDCDGTVDEASAADAITWYADVDGDSFGDADVSTVSCSQPADTVEDNTDCEDGDSSIYPDATEVEDDGIDQNCDGVDSVTPTPAEEEDSGVDDEDGDNDPTDSGDVDAADDSSDGGWFDFDEDESDDVGDGAEGDGGDSDSSEASTGCSLNKNSSHSNWNFVLLFFLLGVLRFRAVSAYK